MTFVGDKCTSLIERLQQSLPRHRELCKADEVFVLAIHQHPRLHQIQQVEDGLLQTAQCRGRNMSFTLLSPGRGPRPASRKWAHAQQKQHPPKIMVPATHEGQRLVSALWQLQLLLRHAPATTLYSRWASANMSNWVVKEKETQEAKAYNQSSSCSQVKPKEETRARREREKK